MSGQPKVRTVQTVVIAVVPEYRLVLVGDADGRHYALTRRTQGIDLASRADEAWSKGVRSAARAART